MSVSLDEESSSPLDEDGKSEELTPERLGSGEVILHKIYLFTHINLQK